MKQSYYLIPVIALLLVGFYYLMKRDNEPHHFDFAVKTKHENICENLFSSPPFNTFQMSDLFQKLGPEFEAAANAQKVNGVFAEGFSAQVPEEVKALHHMAQAPFVRTICETGFNYGHSSFNWLTANPKAIVHSFDLGAHGYAKVMAEKLKAMFPGRHFVHFGDSTKTLPQFILDNPGLKCDVMFVDGGHVYPVALADMKNFIQMASKPDNIIIFDDYPTDWGRSFGKAWEDMLQEKKIVESFRCTKKKHDSLQRGFVAGTVV